MLDAMLDGVVVLGPDGCVEQLSAEASRLLGAGAEGLLSGPVERLPRLGELLGALAQSVRETGRAAIERAHPLPQRRGEDLLLDVAASPLFDDEGCSDGVLIVLRERSAASPVERMVAERDQLEAFGRIALGIAHEVKNPLGGIRGAGEILASRAADSKTKTAAELIVREADRITALVDDFMTLARGEALRLAPVNVHRVLDDVLDLVAMDPLARNIRLERVFDPSLPEIAANADRLVQVFLNLARNALQAMDGVEGTLTFTTGLSLDQRLSDEDGHSLAAVAVEVRDTGPGIPPDVLEKLPTPFFTTRAGGTGLGLALCRHWVTCHGGRMQIESPPGEGTRARVLLPLRRIA